MNCPEVMELMQRQLDNDLTDSEMEVLMHHTRQCPDCAAMLERLQLLSAELTSLPKVAPSYSLVDAIMPQLEQIELTGRQEAAAETNRLADKEEPAAPARREKRTRRWPSMRIAGGVIAAGIVAGLFLVTYKGNVSHDLSNSYSAESRQSDDNATEGLAEDQTLQFYMQEKEETQADVRLESMQKHSSEPSPDGQASGGADPSTGDGAASGQGTRIEERSAQDEPKAVVTGEGVPTFVPQASEDSDAAIGAGAAAAPVEESGSLENGNKSSNDEPVTGFAPAAAPAVASPDGKYNASAEGFQIRIYNTEDQSLVLESTRKNGSLSNLVWSEDSAKLHYEVQLEQGAIEAFVLDIATGEDKKAVQ